MGRFCNCALFFALASLFLTWPVEAVKLDPSVLIMTLKSGEARTERVKVVNDTDAPLSLRVEPEYWYRGGMQQPLADWFKKSVEYVKLPSQGSVTLTLDVAPPDPLDGECVVMVFLAQEPQGAGLAIQTRVGFPVYVRRQGTSVLRGEITEFERLSVRGSAVVFGVTVANTGNVHIVPYGNILLRDDAGKVYYQPFHFEQPVFPGQSRQGQVSFGSGRIPAGHYLAKLELLMDNLYVQDVTPNSPTGFTRQMEFQLTQN